MQRRGCLPKTRPSPYVLYHSEFGRSTPKGVNINRGSSKTRERWGFAHLGWEAWLTPENKLPPHMLPRQIWSLCVKGLRIIRRNPKLGALGSPYGWRWLTPKNMSLYGLLHTYYIAEFGRSRSNGMSASRRSGQKNTDSSRPTFQRQSR